jgi:hypothetical protein
MPEWMGQMSQLCAVTTYFNWEHFHNKRANYRSFVLGMREVGVQVVTIECALGDAEFEFPEDAICVRTQSALWQKERLLNLALAHLPDDCEFVAWIDGDLLFTNPAWAAQASSLLARYPIVQLFDVILRLPRGEVQECSTARYDRGFAARVEGNSQQVTMGSFLGHGHPGFAWAARRDVLHRVGFFDYCILGGADHLMAHAMFGDDWSQCVTSVIDGQLLKDFSSWTDRCYAAVRGKVGHVPGRVLHLWHGSFANRRYQERHIALRQCHFDPARDLEISPDGCWEWTGHNRSLERWAKDYFACRKEDG